MSQVGRSVVVLVAVFVVAACRCDRARDGAGLETSRASGQREGGPLTHENDATLALLALAGNPEADVSRRVHALGALGALEDRSAIPGLQALLVRPRRPPVDDILHADLGDGDRAIDLHIVECLHRLGNDTELGRIAGLVAHLAGGLDDARFDAIDVILSIGRKELIEGLVHLAMGSDEVGRLNALLVLSQVAPRGGPPEGLSSISALSEKVTLTARTERGQLEQLVSLSRGRILLSPDKALELAEDRDHQALDERSGTLRQLVSRYSFGYFVEGDHVVICTHAERGARWGQWWASHAARLEFQRQEQGTFTLQEGP